MPFTVVPTALGTAMDVNLSNASLVFISVTFATMVCFPSLNCSHYNDFIFIILSLTYLLSFEFCSVNLLLLYFSFYLPSLSGEYSCFECSDQFLYEFAYILLPESEFSDLATSFSNYVFVLNSSSPL